VGSFVETQCSLGVMQRGPGRQTSETDKVDIRLRLSADGTSIRYAVSGMPCRPSFDVADRNNQLTYMSSCVMLTSHSLLICVARTQCNVVLPRRKQTTTSRPSLTLTAILHVKTAIRIFPLQFTGNLSGRIINV